MYDYSGVTSIQRKQKKLPNYNPFPVSTLPSLTGPSDVAPISPGGTANIDTNNQIRQMAAGDWTNADRLAALGGYGTSDAFYNQMVQNGGFTPEMITSEKNALSADITGEGNSMASAINSALAQRGLGGNVYAGMQTRQNAAFNAAGQVGRLDNTIRQQQLQNEFQGASGSANNANAKATLYRDPTQEEAMNMIHPEAELPGDPYYKPLGGTGGGGGNPISRPFLNGGGMTLGYNYSRPKTSNYQPQGGAFY